MHVRASLFTSTIKMIDDSKQRGMVGGARWGGGGGGIGEKVVEEKKVEEEVVVIELEEVEVVG